MILLLGLLGVAVFAVTGALAAGRKRMDIFGMVMGVTTGVVGSVLRDVLSGEIPLVFRREIYASASLCGAALLALLVRLNAPVTAAAVVSVLATLLIRLAALHRNLSLPPFHLNEDASEPADQ